MSVTSTCCIYTMKYALGCSSSAPLQQVLGHLRTYCPINTMFGPDIHHANPLIMEMATVSRMSDGSIYLLGSLQNYSSFFKSLFIILRCYSHRHILQSYFILYLQVAQVCHLLNLQLLNPWYVRMRWWETFTSNCHRYTWIPIAAIVSHQVQRISVEV